MQKILICDDHLLFAKGLAEVLLSVNPSYQISTVHTTEDCKVFVQQHDFDIFLCDLNINSKDGFELIADLSDFLQEKKVVIISAYFEDFLIQKAKKLGMNAFLKKDTPVEELILVIEMPLPMDFYVNDDHNQSKNSNVGSNMETITVKFRLSKQEKEIIKLVVKGIQSKEIADILKISKNTVDTHRRNINRKLEITNKSTLQQFAYESDLLL